MPFVAMSSRRPTNGLTKVAPAFAASSACAGEKHSVTLTLMPSPASALQALMPSRVSGTLTTMYWSIFAMSWPSRIMPAKSVAVTSPLTGPLTISQIFFRLALKSPGSFASSDGLVVTPSRMPRSAIAWMSLMLPVSTKIFIARSYRLTGGFFDVGARRADVAGLVDGLHGVRKPHAALDVVEERRLRDRLGRNALQRLVVNRAQHVVSSQIRFAVGFPDQIDRAFGGDRVQSFRPRRRERIDEHPAGRAGRVAF